jgi:hypothetical protein
LYSIDASNGTATQIVTLNGNVSNAGLSCLQGTLYGSDLADFPGASGRDIGSIATDGTITFLSDQNGSSNWPGLASDEVGGILYTIDGPASRGLLLTSQFPDGSVMTIGSGTGIDGRGMAYDDGNGILYAMGTSFDGDLYTVSVISGTSTLIGPTGISTKIVFIGLAYDECNQILYANVWESTGQNIGQLYTLDVTSGAATLVGSNGVAKIDGLAWKGECVTKVTSPIPTLSEWGLIAMAGILGIVGFMVIRRRKVTA